MRDVIPFASYLIWAMQGRGKISNKAIYREVARLCRMYGRVLPLNWESMVRRTLQSRCPGRPRHNGRDDFFVWHGRGLWSCKVAPATDLDLVA